MPEQPTLDVAAAEQAAEHRQRVTTQARCPSCGWVATVHVDALTAGRYCARGCPGLQTFLPIGDET